MAFVSVAVGMSVAGAAGGTVAGGIAAGLGTFAALGGIGMGAAQAAGAFSPNQPNLAASSREMADVQASLLPEQLRLQSMAQTGREALKQGYTMAGDAAQVRAQLQAQASDLQNQIAQIDPNSPLVQRAKLQGQNPIARLNSQLQSINSQISALPESGAVYYNAQGGIVPKEEAMLSFKGFGTADIQRQMMTQQAEAQLALQQKYGQQFVEEAAKQEALANPEAVAARQAMYDLVQKQMQQQPVSPVAQEMNRQIMQKVQAGAGLTPDEQALAAQLAPSLQQISGIKGAQPDYTQALTTGFSGTQRALQSALAGERFLASGETPADVEYRQRQQNLANLSAFISGQTPQSQFKELSGAQGGPAPQYQSPLLPTFQPSGTLGQEAAIQGYGQRMEQVNPWAAGLALTGSAAQTAKQAGLF